MKTNGDRDVAECVSGSGHPDEATIRETLLELAHVRGVGKSFCPSEVARALADEWRPLMPAVRRVAAGLVDQGHLVCTQRGVSVEPQSARGPIRLAIRSLDDGTAGQEADE